MAPEGSKYSTRFIETALNCSSPQHALSYPHPKQRWLIRKHLRALIADYPCFSPSTGFFTHDDGTTVHLLKAIGDLRFPVGSSSDSAVPLAIWLPENYPYVPPLVFVSIYPTVPRIHRAHPFVDPSSGLAIAAYLQNWAFPDCNLTGLVHSLAHIFAIDHPFEDYNFSGQIKTSHPDLASRNEAMDRLAGMLHYDLAYLIPETETEIESLQLNREELRDREDIIASLIIGLEHECRSLIDKVTELNKQAEDLEIWLMSGSLTTSTLCNGDNDDGGGFEAADEESKMVIEHLAADRAVEDVVYELEKALEGEVVSFGAYMRQVRMLFREQFWHREVVVRLRGPTMPDYWHG